MNRLMAGVEYEEAMEWRKWILEIPFIPVKDGWKVAPIPPFSGAAARMRVELPDGRVKSVYLDCYDSLGYFGEPYWEVHPAYGDVARCAMNDVGELVKNIEAED